MYFDFWRDPGEPTQFYQISIPTTYDARLLTFTYIISVVSGAFIVIVPGFQGISKFYFIFRVGISLFILWVISMGIFGQNWEQAHLNTTVPYKVFSRHLIKAEIGVKVGLSSVNITLRTIPLEQEFHIGVKELVDFNERFEWDWRQGREGYGSFAGKVQQQYRAAQHAGTPLPILWAAEAFTMDEEQIRWGRSYRTAGWFTWCVLLTCLPTWAVANLLSLVVAFYAGLLFLVTGFLMLISTIIWSTLRWGAQPLVIVFQDGELRLDLGGSFYLVIAGGLLACVYGAILVFMDLWHPQAASEFLMTGQSSDQEKYYHIEEEAEPLNGDPEQGYSASRRGKRKTIIDRLRTTTQRRKLRPNYRRKREETPSEASDNSAFEQHPLDGDGELRLRSSRHGSGKGSDPPPSYREDSYSDVSHSVVEEVDNYEKTRM